MKKSWFSRFLPDLLAPMIAIFILAFVLSCATRHPTHEIKWQNPVKKLGYTIQVGAFKDIRNAIRLTRQINDRGLWAFYFLSNSGLYKVRFGNYGTKKMALSVAKKLKSRGIIKNFYVISPREYPAAVLQAAHPDLLRNKIVETAKSFIGIPYRWGGQSPEQGFDCSGFTMAVYRLNGLVLPRSSSQQWGEGVLVKAQDIKKGDLVFFTTEGRGRISHVGIYTGGGKFIHAPGKGKRIRIDSLDNSYFKKHFVGARRYI